jgi:glyoxylase I family protein
MHTTLHHIAIICHDLDRSVLFYQQLFGFEVVDKLYRKERHSWKVNMQSGGVHIELFTFPNSPAHQSEPEALGLRHIAFMVPDLGKWCKMATSKRVFPEPIRVDEVGGARYTFVKDPDGLPIELYEPHSH